MEANSKNSSNTSYQSHFEIMGKQWIEYSKCYLQHPTICKARILQELNGYLINQAYLLGNICSTADSVIFHQLYELMSKLTYKEKEQFIHLSRWYNNMQHFVSSQLPITFSRFPLYSSH